MISVIPPLRFYLAITMPAKDASPTTATLPADLSNGMSKDAIIEDLRRRLEESELSSNACSSSSGGRRRRRSRKPKSSLAPNLAATAAPALPLLSKTAATTTKKTKPKETKPVKLVVGLNLNLELELKARIEGDITLSLVVEKKGRKSLPPRCMEKPMNKKSGGVTEVFDVCYIRMGTFSFRQKWIEREVSDSLTAVVALGVLGLGIIVGFICGWATANSGRCYVASDF
ncbi:hypothetical protein F5882DRAFT_154154 [Hyaloscypha sp. PMI_1271]|nr:hypothetical protein F5882DRAFT_154154 [Hyaloscypha sp. PMI_1271]